MAASVSPPCRQASARSIQAPAWSGRRLHDLLQLLARAGVVAAFERDQRLPVKRVDIARGAGLRGFCGRRTRLGRLKRKRHQKKQYGRQPATSFQAG